MYGTTPQESKHSGAANAGAAEQSAVAISVARDGYGATPDAPSELRTPNYRANRYYWSTYYGSGSGLMFSLIFGGIDLNTSGSDIARDPLLLTIMTVLAMATSAYFGPEAICQCYPAVSGWNKFQFGHSVDEDVISGMERLKCGAAGGVAAAALWFMADCLFSKPSSEWGFLGNNILATVLVVLCATVVRVGYGYRNELADGMRGMQRSVSALCSQRAPDARALELPEQHMPPLLASAAQPRASL